MLSLHTTPFTSSSFSIQEQETKGVVKGGAGIGSFMSDVRSSQEIENDLKRDSSDIALRRRISQMMMGTMTVVIVGGLITALVIFLIADSS